MTEPTGMSAPNPEGRPFDVRHATLGDVLVQVGVLTPEQLQMALRRDPSQKNLPQVLETMGFATEEKILKGVSIQMGIPYFKNLDGIIDPETARTIPEHFARKHTVIPLFKADDSLIVGMANPLDVTVIDEMAAKSGLHIRPVMVPFRTVMQAIFTTHTNAPERPFEAVAPAEPDQPIETVEPVGKAVSEPADVVVGIAEEQLIRFQADDHTVTKELNAIIEEGVLRKASDIHLEAGEKVARVRYRVDGILHDGRTFSSDRYVALVARVKILAELDITETRLPQDGHIGFVNSPNLPPAAKGILRSGQSVDIRVAIIRGVFGEKVVMRILDSNKSLRRLQDLEMSAPVLKMFSEAIHQPNNIILVTGPTGSGKTTTLYSAMTELNDLTRNIVTLEDPVEYRIDRITQIEVHPKIGLTFAAGLRSILRLDPNIVLIGEIRDTETAEIAIQVAITGHQVFSSLHTNDAVGAINRLITMNIEPFLISAALAGVMAQRLVRRLCDKCIQPHVLTDSEIVSLHLAAGAGPFFKSAGCPACFNTGYMGRLAIYEWLPVSRAIKDLIVKGASVDQLRDLAIKEGMMTLRDDALAKASQGKTSITEILRVSRNEKGT
jgi:type IV pilus assembly protein PilB